MSELCECGRPAEYVSRRENYAKCWFCFNDELFRLKPRTWLKNFGDSTTKTYSVCQLKAGERSC